MMDTPKNHDERGNKRAWQRFDISEWNEPAHVAAGERVCACQALNYSALGLAMVIPPGLPIPASGILEFRGAMFSYDTRSCYQRGNEQIVGVALQSLMPSIYEVIPNRPIFGASSPYFTPKPMGTSYVQWLIAAGLLLAVLLVVVIHQTSSWNWMYQALSGFAPGRQFVDPAPNSQASWFTDVLADGCHGLLLAATQVDIKAHLQRTRDVLTRHQLELSQRALGQGDFRSALEAADRALELHGHSPEGFLLRGRARLALGLRAFAVADLKQAIFLDKLNLSRYQEVTDLLCDAFEFGEAFELCLHGSRAVQPKNLKAMTELTQSVYDRAASHSKASGDLTTMTRVLGIAEQWVKTHEPGSTSSP
jgi:hypothetical protein